MRNVMMNNNRQEFDFSVESLFLSLLFKGYTHNVPSDQLFEIRGTLTCTNLFK